MINQTAYPTFTTSVLIGDTYYAPLGSNDSIPYLTESPLGGDVSAALEIQSTLGALLISRVTLAERNSLKPYPGMMIYNLSTDSFNIFVGPYNPPAQPGAWLNIGENAGGGDVTGPGESVPGNIATFADDSGKVIKDSGVNIADVEPPVGSLFARDTVKEMSQLDILSFNQTGLVFVNDTYPIMGFFVDAVEPFERTVLITDGVSLAPTSVGAILELKTTTGAMLFSRVTTEQMNAIAVPENGMLVYNTDNNGAFYGYVNGAWTPLNTGTGTAPSDAKYIIQEANSNLPNAQSLGLLTTGLLKNTVTSPTGVLSRAVPGVDYYAPAFPTYLVDTNGSTNNLFVGTNAGNSTGTGGSSSIFGINAYTKFTTGNQNVGMGLNVLNSVTTASNSTAIGYQSQESLTGGSNNTSLGSQSLNENAIGSGNTSLGYQNMFGNIGSNNTSTGIHALAANAGSDNCAYGANSLLANVGGTQSCAYGSGSLSANLNATGNCAFGYQSAQFNVSGTGISVFGFQAAKGGVLSTSPNNTSAFGYQSLQNVTGNSNSAFGYQSAQTLTTGIQNCAFGEAALFTASTSGQNSAFGYHAMFRGDSPNSSAFGWMALSLGGSGSNVAMGDSALGAATSGNQSTAIGSQAMSLGSGPGDCVGVGFKALNNVSALGNTSIGSQSSVNLSSGQFNTVSGFGAYTAATSISQSSVYGAQSQADCQTNGPNDSFGYNTLNSLTSGNGNAVFGGQAMQSASNASNNSVFGFESMSAFQSGTGNSFFGTSSALSLQSGNNNTGLGTSALSTLTSGSSGNTAIGAQAGEDFSNLNNCTFLGYQSRAASAGLANATAIGYNSTINMSNCINLGNNARVGINAPSPGYALHIENVGSTGQAAIYLQDTQTGPGIPSTGGVLFVGKDNTGAASDDIWYAGHGKYVNLSKNNASAPLDAKYILEGTTNTALPNSKALGSVNSTPGGGLLSVLPLLNTLAKAVANVDYVDPEGLKVISDLLQGQIDDLELAVGTLEEQVGDIFLAIDALEGLVSTLEGQVGDILTAILSLRAAITVLQDEINILSTRTSTLEARVDELDTELAALITRITNLEARVAAVQAELQGEIDAVASDVAALDAAVALLNEYFFGFPENILITPTPLTLALTAVIASSAAIGASLDHVAAGTFYVQTSNILLPNAWAMDELENRPGILYIGEQGQPTIFNQNIFYGPGRPTYLQDDAPTTGNRNLFVGTHTANLPAFTNLALDNTGMGYGSVQHLVNGGRNSAYGSGSLNAIVNGFSNSAYGVDCMSQLVSNTRNCGFGDSALRNIIADDCAAFGYQSSIYVQTGARNSTFGSGSLADNTGSNPSDVCAFGYQSLAKNQASFACAFGSQSLHNNTSGIQNSAFGSETLSSNSAQNNNTAFGHGVLALNGEGITDAGPSDNSGFGALCLANNVLGAGLCAFGYSALSENNAPRNSAFGWNSQSQNIFGVDNSSFGYNSLSVSENCNRNSCFGAYAFSSLGLSDRSDDNCAFGFASQASAATGTRNNSYGSNSMIFFQSGNGNNSYGYNSLYAMVTGSNNSVFGDYALSSANANVFSMCAFGSYALSSQITEGLAPSCAFGANSLRRATGANGCIAIGSNALESPATPDSMTAIGTSAFSFSGDTSNESVALGSNAGGVVLGVTWNSCTLIGANTDAANSGTYTNATALGANTIIAQDNTVILGNGADVGIGTNAPQSKLHVVGEVRQQGIASGFPESSWAQDQVGIQTTGPALAFSLTVPVSPPGLLFVKAKIIGFSLTSNTTYVAESKVGAYWNGTFVAFTGGVSTINPTMDMGFEGTVHWGVNGDSVVLALANTASTINWVITYEYFGVTKTI